MTDLEWEEQRMKDDSVSDMGNERRWCHQQREKEKEKWVRRGVERDDDESFFYRVRLRCLWHITEGWQFHEWGLKF